MQVQVLDTEVYRDYYLAMFRDVATGETRAFEMFDGHPFDGDGVRSVLRTCRIVTFNGNNFDLPLLILALKGADCAKVKAGADAIIKQQMRSWNFERQFGVKVPTTLDHVDLIEVAPGVASLKIYGGRMHCRKMQDLPIDPDASISSEQRAQLRTYCGNDLETTTALYTHLLPQIELREQMGKTYGLDLRSKSDAQIAEAVIASEVGKIRGCEVKKPTFESGTSFRYTPPGFIRFATKPLQDVLDLITRLDFVVPSTGAVTIPKELADTKIAIGDSVYRMGIGGLHSSEKTAKHVADANTVLVDRDVVSYYPEIILKTGLTPAHMGDAFTQTFRTILKKRVEAKRAGHKVVADSLKITVNGSFGKFGSKWSKLYAPHLLIQTTITGQLSLLMLIEALESEGIPVVSANTDGAVIKCPIQKVPMMSLIVWEWEERTGFETEATEYAAIYSRDVNNYIALKKGGGAKLKGAFAPAGLQKNPTNEICTDAVVKHLLNGTPIEQTITACTDPRKFVSVRQVKGGAVKDGAYLGKAVRWYYSIAAAGDIQYKLNGNKVPRSDGAEPLMELPDAVPADVDYDWYIAEANDILKDIGAR
jgi:DNA polymerase elongation subunit (family B)